MTIIRCLGASQPGHKFILHRQNTVIAHNISLMQGPKMGPCGAKMGSPEQDARILSTKALRLRRCMESDCKRDFLWKHPVPLPVFISAHHSSRCCFNLLCMHNRQSHNRSRRAMIIYLIHGSLHNTLYSVFT